MLFVKQHKDTKLTKKHKVLSFLGSFLRQDHGRNPLAPNQLVKLGEVSLGTCFSQRKRESTFHYGVTGFTEDLQQRRI